VCLAREVCCSTLSMSSLFSFGQSSQSQQSSVSSGSSSEQPPQSSQPSSSSTNVWGWFEQASKNTKELISQAQVVATELSKQALEMKENYDSEVQNSILSNLENSSKLKQKGVILLPRESAKLEDIDLIYMTENMVGMGFPHDPRKEMHIKGNRIDDVAGYLKTHHSGRFMIWNISEESYDYSLFSDQVEVSRFFIFVLNLSCRCWNINFRDTLLLHWDSCLKSALPLRVG
jgi:hypothetical protein